MPSTVYRLLSFSSNIFFMCVIKKIESYYESFLIRIWKRCFEKQEPRSKRLDFIRGDTRIECSTNFHFIILHSAFGVRHWKKYQVTSIKYQDASRAESREPRSKRLDSIRGETSYVFRPISRSVAESISTVSLSYFYFLPDCAITSKQSHTHHKLMRLVG
jgi:hypothetical protein